MFQHFHHFWVNYSAEIEPTPLTELKDLCQLFPLSVKKMFFFTDCQMAITFWLLDLPGTRNTLWQPLNTKKVVPKSHVDYISMVSIDLDGFPVICPIVKLSVYDERYPGFRDDFWIPKCDQTLTIEQIAGNPSKSVEIIQI